MKKLAAVPFITVEYTEGILERCIKTEGEEAVSALS
jgi:hypothetical protein